MVFCYGSPSRLRQCLHPIDPECFFKLWIGHCAWYLPFAPVDLLSTFLLPPPFRLIWIFHLFSISKTDDMIINILKIERFCMKINLDFQILMRKLDLATVLAVIHWHFTFRLGVSSQVGRASLNYFTRLASVAIWEYYPYFSWDNVKSYKVQMLGNLFYWLL